MNRSDVLKLLHSYPDSLQYFSHLITKKNPSYPVETKYVTKVTDISITSINCQYFVKRLIINKRERALLPG